MGIGIPPLISAKIAMTSKFQAEFDRLLSHKKSSDLMIERIFKPEKYPEFHLYLNMIHEEWIVFIRKD